MYALFLFFLPLPSLTGFHTPILYIWSLGEGGCLISSPFIFALCAVLNMEEFLMLHRCQCEFCASMWEVKIEDSWISSNMIPLCPKTTVAVSAILVRLTYWEVFVVDHTVIPVGPSHCCCKGALSAFGWWVFLSQSLTDFSHLTRA